MPYQLQQDNAVVAEDTMNDQFEKKLAQPMHFEQEMGQTSRLDDEVLLMMSLSLDGLLDEEEESQLQARLARNDALAATWQLWRRVDQTLTQALHVAPPLGFVHRFEQRLADYEQKALQRANLFVVMAATLIWVGLLAVLIGAGVYAYTNQALWMNNLIHRLTLYAANLNQWWNALQIVLTSAFSSPQTVSMAVGYACAGGAILLWWVHFLRNSTHAAEIPGR
jgi:hypothetical protein